MAPSPPPEAPRPGSPPLVVLPSSLALWVGAGATLIFGIALVVALLMPNGEPLLAAIPLALGVVIGLVGLVVRASELRVWRDGAACEAEVTRGWTDTSGASESRTSRSYVQYRYTYEGRSFEGKYQTRWEWKPGPIWVVCDRARPERSVPYRDPG